MMGLAVHRAGIGPAGGATLADGLVLSMDLEEASGNAIDAIGADGVSTGTDPTQVTGATAGHDARAVAAASSKFLRPYNDDIMINDEHWGISFWFDPVSGGSNATILGASIGSASASVGDGWNIQTRSSGSNRTRFFVNVGGSSFVVVEMPSLWGPGWQHVFAYHDPDANELGGKVSGNSAATPVTHSGGQNASTRALGILSNANGSSNREIGAAICALRIWKGAAAVANVRAELSWLESEQRTHADLEAYSV